MLKEIRASRGMTPRQMYERLGVQDSRYRKWEAGAAAIPLEYACQCCDILHCSLDELAGRKPLNLAAEESELVSLYRGSNVQGRAAIMAVARSQQGVAGDAQADTVEKAV